MENLTVRGELWTVNSKQSGYYTWVNDLMVNILQKQDGKWFFNANDLENEDVPAYWDKGRYILIL